MKLFFADFLKLKSLSLYLLASIITAIVGILINPFLSIGLSHKDFAVIGYYASFVTLFLPLTAFTLNNYYSRKYYLVDKKTREEIYQTILSVFFIYGFLSLFFLIIIYYFYHRFFVKSIEFSPYAILSFLPLFFGNFYNLYLLDLRMKNEAKKYFFISLLVTIISALSSLLLVYIYKFGAEGRLTALLISSIFSFFLVFFLKKYKFYINFKIVREAFLFCWPLVISAVLTFFFIGVDRVFLEKINDNKNLGLYNIGIQIAGYYMIYSTAIFQTFNPNVYEYASQQKYAKLVKLFLLIISLITFPLLIFIFVSKYFISVITFDKYTDASIYANIIVFKSLTFTFAFYVSDTMIAMGFTKYEMYNKIWSTILVIALYYYLISNYSFLGAAFGQVISWFIMGLVSVIYLGFNFRKKLIK